MTDFDRDYKSADAFFGARPEPMLERFVDQLRAPLLVVGAGQGRNALYLARRGLEAVAIDPSAVAVDTLRSGNPSIDARHERFESFRFERPFGGVLVFGLLPILDEPPGQLQGTAMPTMPTLRARTCASASTGSRSPSTGTASTAIEAGARSMCRPSRPSPRAPSGGSRC